MTVKELVHEESSVFSANRLEHTLLILRTESDASNELIILLFVLERILDDVFKVVSVQVEISSKFIQSWSKEGGLSWTLIWFSTMVLIVAS